MRSSRFLVRSTFLVVVLCLAVSLTLLSAAGLLNAETGPPPALPRCVIVELYYRDGDTLSDATLQAMTAECQRRAGVVLVPRNVTTDAGDMARFQRVINHFRLGPEALPLVYAANRTVAQQDTAEEFCAGLRAALKMEVFVREGCPRCANAKLYLADLQRRYPGFEVNFRSLISDPTAVPALNELVAKHRTGAASVPAFHFCDRLLIGFAGPSITGPRLEAILATWTTPCRRPASASPSSSGVDGAGTPGTLGRGRVPFLPNLSAQVPWRISSWALASVSVLSASDDAAAVPDAAAELDGSPTLPLPDVPRDAEVNLGDLPLPDDLDTSSTGPGQAEELPDAIDLPVFGRLKLKQVSLTALTLAIGLVDGFNPCAMWVLLFLLSLLVNLRDRRKVLLISGAFILVSGLAYLAFMAAWLNVFLLVGYLRPIQVLLGVVAVIVGSIHIKDFFAFHQGVSLSIPESAKPSIYARTRQILNAENLSGALASVIVLAVMVNVVELLCTAGLPALYTEILSSYQLPVWENYAYLTLYILAYMFDDSLMVAAVVITLRKQKLQEHHGRWLKLISGSVIAALGLVMIAKPEWLM